MRLNSQAGTRGFAFVLFLNCDRPSHPDWGHLGVVRADGMDNRWQGPAALLGRTGPHHCHPTRETCRLSWALKCIVQAPVLEGLRIGPVLGLSAGGGWKHVK